MAEDKHIADASSEVAIEDVFDMDNLESTDVSLTMGDDADSTHVAAACDGGDIADFKLDKLLNLASFEERMSMHKLNKGDLMNMFTTMASRLLSDSGGDVL